MSEGASQLDLQVLSQDIDYSRLTPAEKKIPIHLRNNSRFFLVIAFIAGTALIVRWLLNDFQPGLYPLIVTVLLVGSIYLRERVKDIYYLSEKGLHIPYMWFYHRVLPFDSIIRVVDETIEDDNKNRKYGAIRILVDTPFVKLNVSGLQTSSVLLSTMVYDSIALNRFADEIIRRKRENNAVPNTLAQRLTDQVNRAWSKRWLLIIMTVFDASSEGLIYLFILEGLVFGFFGVSIWPIMGSILIGALIILVFVIQLLNKPQAIVGFRPHELGPLIYDEEDLITSVRFIVMCHPYTIQLLNCEMIYPDDVAKQVGRLNQIHPDYVERGELTYGIAQIVGNHTKAKGAILTFRYKEKEGSRDYQIPLEWA